MFPACKWRAGVCVAEKIVRIFSLDIIESTHCAESCDQDDRAIYTRISAYIGELILVVARNIRSQRRLRLKCLNRTPPPSVNLSLAIIAYPAVLSYRKSVKRTFGPPWWYYPPTLRIYYISGTSRHRRIFYPPRYHVLQPSVYGQDNASLFVQGIRHLPMYGGCIPKTSTI